MRAVEFKSSIKNNLILIPDNLKKEIQSSKSKQVRVIVLFDQDMDDEDAFKNLSKATFLKGYDDSDSIYDK